mmetsp:Transcript_89748/g.262386  ORF Transcript_89748/g.262386 Transcript_89748/m.262386 type:complete len:272 (+) Transcript_89748:117-932(+)
MQVSVIGLDGNEVLSTTLPADGTVHDLQQRVFEASGVGPLAQRLVLDSKVLPPASSLVAAGVADGATVTLVVTPPSVEYRVMQAVLLKKCGRDPALAEAVLQLERRVGYKVRTTGQTWVGPAGGTWVEQDPSSSAKPGWLLVEGPGFKYTGPLLEEIAPGEEEPRILRVRSPANDEDMLELCLRPSLTLQEAKVWMARRLPGLAPRKIVFVKKRRAHRSTRLTPEEWILSDSMRIRDTAVEDGDELPYLYMGDAEDYDGALQSQAAVRPCD